MEERKATVREVRGDGEQRKGDRESSLVMEGAVLKSN